MGGVIIHHSPSPNHLWVRSCFFCETLFMAFFSASLLVSLSVSVSLCQSLCLSVCYSLFLLSVPFQWLTWASDKIQTPVVTCKSLPCLTHWPLALPTSVHLPSKAPKTISDPPITHLNHPHISSPLHLLTTTSGLWLAAPASSSNVLVVGGPAVVCPLP